MQHGRRFKPAQFSAVDNAATPPLRAALWLWLACGLMALLAFPGLRGCNATIGWVPFWLVIAPSIDLALMRRRWLLTTSRAFFVRARRRRRPARRQTRLLRRQQVTRMPNITNEVGTRSQRA